MSLFLPHIFLMLNYCSALKASEITCSATYFRIQQPDSRVSVTAGIYETDIFCQIGPEIQNVTFSKSSVFWTEFLSFCKLTARINIYWKYPTYAQAEGAGRQMPSGRCLHHGSGSSSLIYYPALGFEAWKCHNLWI